MAVFHLPYHKLHMNVEIPDNPLAGSLESRVNTYKPGLGQAEIVHKALDHPIGGLPLESWVTDKNRMTLLTSDHKRPMPSWLTLPILLERIRKSAPDIEIHILVATGNHRATTPEEMIALFGEKIEYALDQASQIKGEIAKITVIPDGVSVQS